MRDLFSPKAIEAEYQRRIRAHPDARWGWSFMYVPENTLPRARAVLVGLNPGGRQIDPPYHWDHRSGENAYVDQDWNGQGPGANPLQRQVALMFDAVGVHARDVFAANFVPFRSPAWVDLPDKDGALSFARGL